MKRLLLILFYVVITTAANPVQASPTTAPAPAGFKVYIEVRMEGREAKAAEVFFFGDHALSLTNDREPSGFFNLAAGTMYVERLDRMVADRAVVSWLEEWRKGNEAKRLLADPQQGAVIKAAIWPDFQTTERAGNLSMRSKGYQVEITALPDADENMAWKFATYSKLERYANAFELQKPHLAFVPAAIAEVLRDRKVFPTNLTMTTSQGTAKATFRVDALTEREVSMVKSVAKELGASEPAPATQLAD